MASPTPSTAPGSRRPREVSPALRRVALSGLVHHLVEARQGVELLRLVAGDRAWMDEKFKSEGSDEPYATDLRMALDATSDAAGRAAIRTALVVVRERGRRVEDRDLGTLVRLDRAEQAVAYARTRATPMDICRGLRRISETLELTGKPTQAVLLEIQNQVTTASSSDLHDVAIECASAFASCGRLVDAMRLAGLLGDPGHRSRVHSHALKTAARRGASPTSDDIERVTAAASTGEEPDSGVRALCTLHDLIADDRPERASRLLGLAQVLYGDLDPRERSIAPAPLARSLSLAGRHAEAWTLVEACLPGTDRDEAWRALALRAAEGGDDSAAQAVAS